MNRRNSLLLFVRYDASTGSNSYWFWIKDKQGFSRFYKYS